MKNNDMRVKICFKSMGSDKIKYCEGSYCIAATIIKKAEKEEDNEYVCILLKKGD